MLAPDISNEYINSFYILTYRHKKIKYKVLYSVKLFICKKSLIITLAVILAFGAIAGICAGAMSASAHDGLHTVVIDAGHGGVDAGVRGVTTSVKESEINLSVSKYLRGYFADAGFNAVMTRTTQGGLYGTSTKGFKMRDMKKRKEIIENNDADMVISVHQNFCPIPSRRGGTVFFDKNSECGKLLALCIQNSLNSMKECVKKNEALTGDYFILKCTENPSVIVECGFLSNADDEALLLNEDYKKMLAYAIFKGAVAYYS